MGIFSKIFGGRKITKGKIVDGKNPGKSWIYANKFNKARGGFAGGYGAWTFGNIMNAHCTPADIVETFELNTESNAFACPAYSEAYKECWDEAEFVYEQIVAYYMELIEACQSEINELESDIRDCEEEIEDLREQIEQCREEIEDIMSGDLDIEDLDEILDLREEIEECQDKIEELQEEIEDLQEEIAWLQNDIDGYYDEIESTSIEELLDHDELEKRAFEYACEFAQVWIDGNTWIPLEVLNWAYYDVSDHNR